MKSSSPLPWLLTALVALSSLAATACKTECKDVGGKTVCTAKSLTGYVGTPVMQQADWTNAQPIEVAVDGGNVRLGTVAATAVQVLPYDATKNAAPTKIYVEFTPVTAVPAEEKEQAIQQMSTQLTFTAAPAANGALRVAVTPTGTTDSSLSASVRLYLPASFNGSVTVTNGAGGKTNGALSIQGANGNVRALTATGDISISGASANVVANTDVGNVTVVLSAPLTASAEGSIVTGHGDVALTVKQASNVSLQAAASVDGQVVATDPLPAGWQTAVSSAASKSFTGNAGSATPWTLSAGGAASKITLIIAP